jgi:hypothetical protein
MKPLTIDDLRHRREQALVRAGRAVAARPAAYRDLKALVHTINSSLLDISEYDTAAGRLGQLLEEIDNGAETLFAYFMDRIDPRKEGEALYFRFECLDLAEQVADLDQWRADQHCLRRVK